MVNAARLQWIDVQVTNGPFGGEIAACQLVDLAPRGRPAARGSDGTNGQVQQQWVAEQAVETEFVGTPQEGPSIGHFVAPGLQQLALFFA